MIAYDMKRVQIANGAIYENCINESGREVEWLDGVELTDGHYCKHYRKARCFRDAEEDCREEEGGEPPLQHYCGKSGQFLGFAYCCMSGCGGFEQGQAAEVERIRNRIRSARETAGWALDGDGNWALRVES